MSSTKILFIPQKLSELVNDAYKDAHQRSVLVRIQIFLNIQRMQNRILNLNGLILIPAGHEREDG
jgi:hypothetical protein